MPLHNQRLEIYTLPRLTIFVTVVNETTWRRAARVLQISETAVKKNISALERAFDHRPLLESDPNGRLQTTDLGRAVYDRARRMLYLGVGLDNLNRVVRPERTVAFLPHHAEFIARMVADLDESPDFDLQVEVLGEQHRSVDVFQRAVIGSLIAGTYDVVVGPPPGEGEADDDLDTRELYEAKLVALVPEAYPDELSIGDLAEPSQHGKSTKLLVPPPDTRAGRMIRNALNQALGAEASLDEKIRLAAHGTKVLAIFGSRDLGIVVVPSDIAHAFGPGGTLYGPRLRTRKWVPIRDHQGEYLTHKVVATVRHASLINDPAIEDILGALKIAVTAELKSDLVTVA